MLHNSAHKSGGAAAAAAAAAASDRMPHPPNAPTASQEGAVDTLLNIQHGAGASLLPKHLFLTRRILRSALIRAFCLQGKN